MSTTVTRFTEWLPLIVLSVGLASALEAFVTVEWWYPYCSAPEDGPAVGVFGAPLPYSRFSGVSSLTYLIMPHALAFDVAAIAAGLALLATAIRSRMERAWARRAAYGLGATLLLARLAWVGFLVSSGWWIPVWSIENPPYMSYEELRPAQITTSSDTQCEP